MKKLLISFLVFYISLGIIDFWDYFQSAQAYPPHRFFGHLSAALFASLSLWFADQYWNHFKAPKTEMLLSVSAETFRMIQTNKCIELPDGRKIELQETNGKFKGLSPWNFNTWRSRVEIVFIDAHDQIVNLRCKTRSINKIQIFDFGYNTRFLDSISKSLT